MGLTVGVLLQTNKENLLVILAMKDNSKSYHNEKNVLDGWTKTQGIEI